ncbi:EAL and HDOD domain-containing protein [Photobacterium aphoticum]|uniref:Histidine kinase n=1 Tax=Photobacterium aphoticum TaxID=754436 RepID=A0A0J1GP57_9GAMM|nr:HDOD domain-containing protein [Photobacterium aphoticum]KLV01558.1 histidine kinase [Photobacterium aphoticum]PSU52708.1 HDOD domain-containing protein [Photobacterium aphoticum]GHA43417.1 diguanylate cyclase [Photobacterium aphoticum]
MYAYVARQPIFNRQQKTVGYELLFRDGESNAFPNIDANKATCRLLVENFIAVGSDDADRGKRRFINFPQQSLVRLLPTLLPKKQVVIEVLETCEPNDELFLAIRHLYRMGYMIALDDFEMDPRWARFLPYVHIIKLDLMKLGLAAACEFVANNRHRKLMFLAEKVETQDEFNVALEAGFHFFQGYFFSRPQVLKNRQITPERVATLRLLQEVCRPEVDFARVEQIIIADVSLSYLLLRYVNNAAQQVKVPIRDFRQALVYLGEARLRMFVSAVATAQAAVNKPHELFVLSLVRGRMCEVLAQSRCVSVDGRTAFMTGLLSLLDALLDCPLPELLAQLPLEQDIRRALLERQGALGQILNLVEAFEQADWRTVNQYGRALGISGELVGNSYQQAMQWVNQYLAITQQ